MPGDNVIYVDFAAERRDGDDFKERLAEQFAELARKRGYSADRASEIAGIICETASAMQRESFSVSGQIDFADIEGSVRDLVQQAVRQAVAHCANEMARAACDLCYPFRGDPLS